MFEREEKTVSRREFLKMAGIAGAAVGVGAGLGGLVAACGGEAETTTTTAAGTTTTAAASTTTVSAGPEAGRDIKIGLVAPKTGGLAFFAIADDWWVAHANETIKDGIVTGDGKSRKIEIVVRDTQSDSNRAAQVTADLIQVDKVDLVLSSGSPDTVNPVADQCEALGCPNLNSWSPWQAFVYGRNAPAEGFKWTYGNLLGSEQTMYNFTEMFDQIPNNKVVGMLFANDADAQGWMAEDAAPKVFKEKGYKLVVPQYYQPGAEDFTQQISQFKKEGCDIVCGTNNPAEFTNFWTQSYQQGFRPKLVSSGKALLFPQALQAIGDIGYGLIGEIGWHNSWPFKDTLTGMNCQELADDFEAKTKTQWTPVIGAYAKFEWAVDVFKRAKNPEDKESIVEAIRATNTTFIMGPVDMTAPVDPATVHPTPNVVKPTYAGGQWVKGAKYPFEIVVCSVAQAPGTQVQAKVQPMVYKS